MNILVYGAGVLGCNLANDLFRAGKNVTLLARGAWAKELQQNGLRIQSKFPPRTSLSRSPVVTAPAPNVQYDVIFVALRYTQLETVLDTLRENPAKNIVFVGNNVRAEETAAQLPGKNVLFAFPSIAGHREAYEPNMGDFLLCHAAFVLPAAFACYKTGGNLKRIWRDNDYLNRLIDANLEGYRAIRNAGHAILPESDADFEGPAYRKTCLRFFKLMCATSLGKICASDHAMNAIGEMSALNRELKHFFDETGAEYPVWRQLEQSCEGYLK